MHITTSATFVTTLVLASLTAHHAFATDDEREPGVRVGRPLAGYRGIWHGQEPTGDEYHFKYSGGLATYTAKHIPLAVHAPSVAKTFFVYGAVREDEHNFEKRPHRLIAAVGVYDHRTRRLAQPIEIHNKNTHDPHDNASLAIDDQGHLWVVISGRGRGRKGWIYRSTAPHDISQFELIHSGEYTYPQPWHVPNQGFLFLFTKYLGGRQLFFRSGALAGSVERDQKLAAFGGHYQLSRRVGNRVGIAFNWHPRGVVNDRTNLYYIETADLGRTWQTATGESVQLPIDRVDHPSRVVDYQAQGKRAYLNDLVFDTEGRPIILHVVSDGWQPGPANAARVWTTAHFHDGTWHFNPVCHSDHNYDTGLLDVVDENCWRVIGPTETGPQAFHTGGQIALYESIDAGRSWKRTRQLTKDATHNHTYVRPVINAHDDFFALWADGNAAEPSACRLYFCNRAADQVFKLPESVGPEGMMPLAMTWAFEHGGP